MCNSEQDKNIEDYMNVQLTLWQIILNIELLVTIYRMQNRVFQKTDLEVIMKLADESSPYNQLFAHKLL